MENCCKNCGTLFTGNFCNNCGQSAETHEINLHFLWHDIQHGLFHFDKGILYTNKQLFTRPGHSIREYIQGKRINHFKPISLTILMATLYALVYHLFHINLFEFNDTSSFSKIDSNQLNEWIFNHYSIVTLATVPIFSVASFVVFRKQDYNYTEHVVLNSFAAVQRLTVHLLFLPVFYFFHTQKGFSLTTEVLTVIDILLMYSCYSQFFNLLSKIKSFFLTLASYAISYLLMVIILFIIMTIVG
ncbi:membrane protein [Flavobacterium cauense R2A-7]|uniref:Uncharacterized protein DUF3667 n=1 Tax=Flavobacterium cauense R2A-7 TaxID=1341154 RepID=V6RWT7_9FLAO|nr:DUF3667 domain-containing protein [Flavobacterium cauense]ESU18946.1 membrane protein [Flavobacterium cauense R2A-7]TWI15396.1 uncharacterized protein DUF3667 [Flavobacterium cauense R2A-7]